MRLPLSGGFCRPACVSVQKPVFFLSLSVIAIVSGCGTQVLPTDASFNPTAAQLGQPKGDNADSNQSTITSPDMPAVQSVVYEGDNQNDVFENAQPAPLPSSGEITVEAFIQANGDVDFFALGAVAAGDRITVDVAGLNGLNTVAALFDGSGNLIDANDDRSYYGGRLDPYVSSVLRSDAENLFIGVAVSRAAYFASSSGRYETGQYSMKIRREPGNSVPSAQSQVVWLDFEGGATVQIGQEPVEHMRPFSAEAISPRLAGKTDYIIQLILDHMAHDFQAYNVTLLNSRQHTRPSSGYSQLFFGNRNDAFLGLADNVDTGNVSLVQEAIIYAEDMAMFDQLLPTAEEVAQALANVASHELGHLLGLEHTADAADLMSTAASARQILEHDASFIRATLNTGVFPTGWQNNPVTLVQNVGASHYQASARMSISDESSVGSVNNDWRNDVDANDLPVLKCNRCAGGHHHD